MSTRILPARKRDWLQLIEQLGVQPSKGRGQNFLLDPDVVHRIVRASCVTRDELVVEIGPGLGILTESLLERSGSMLAVEIDPLLAAHIRTSFAPIERFGLIEGDALKVDLAAITDGKPYKLVGNLPYSVGTAIVQHVLESAGDLKSATVMVQREVGERMLADPPHMSILSVAVQVYASGSIDLLVPPESFWPSPKVDSIVLTLRPHATRLLEEADRASFFALVNGGFRHKRKNIANSLHDETKLAKAEIEQRLRSAEIDPIRRAQTLSVQEWLHLATVWAATPVAS
jgi:16S rRNA (adenine1518-N6/adenine1519-N6)-dimethyltransferase